MRCRNQPTPLKASRSNRETALVCAVLLPGERKAVTIDRVLPAGRRRFVSVVGGVRACAEKTGEDSFHTVFCVYTVAGLVLLSKVLQLSFMRR